MISLFFLTAYGSELTQSEFRELAERSYKAHFVGRSATPVTLRSDVVRWPGGAKVRVHPQVEGLEVDGASAVIALDPTGVEVRTTGGRTLKAPVRGAFSQERAIAVAEQVSLGRGTLWAPRAEEVALVHNDEVRHAWRVSRSTADPLNTWLIWVSAVDGEVLQLTQTSHTVSGSVYSPSPAAGPPVEVEIEELNALGRLSGRFSDSFSCREWDLPENFFESNRCLEKVRWGGPPKPSYEYEPRPGFVRDPFAEVNLYYHVTRAALWWESHYTLRRAQPFTSISNFPMANAFYGDFDGDGLPDLSFGFDGRRDYGYDGDVVYHEFGHWVVSRLADLPSLGADEDGLNWVGGSLNEGVADVFSMLIEPDPLLGEYAGRSYHDGPIRDLMQDRQCPQHLEGEVHHDGEIIGALGWNLIDTIGVELTGDLFVGAVATWGPEISWDRAGESLLEAADDLLSVGVLSEAEHQTIGELIQQTGMVGCPRVRVVASGEELGAYIISAGLQGDLYRISGQNQVMIKTPDDIDQLSIPIRNFRGQDGLGWSVLIRKEKPILNAVTSLSTFGLGFSTPTEWDWLFESDAEELLIELNASSDPPFEPGATYYIEVAGRNAGALDLFEYAQGHLEYSVDLARFEPTGTCSSVGSRGGAVWAMIALLWWRKRC